MRSEVIAEVTKLRNQEIGQAQQELQQQLQQQVHWNLPMIRTHYMLQQTCVQAVACQLSVRERERIFFFKSFLDRAVSMSAPEERGFSAAATVACVRSCLAQLSGVLSRLTAAANSYMQHSGFD